MLDPRLTEFLVLPDGKEVTVRKCAVPFAKWKGGDIPNVYRKPVISLDGEPMYAELAVLRLLEASGWRALWVDSYCKCFRQYMPHIEPPLAELGELPPIRKYPSGFQKFGGPWDVVAWKDDRIIFLECKRKDRDAIRTTQLQWLQDRLAEGIDSDSFIIVEWTLPGTKPDALDLRAGRWYAYEMIGAYGNPYFSPILIEHIRRSGRRVDMRFWNVRYAEGVQDFEKRFEVIRETPSHLVAKIDGQPERTAIIAELRDAWPSVVVPEDFLIRNPVTTAERETANYEGYLNRVMRPPSL